MKANADENREKTLLGTSNADDVTPVNVYVDPVTHRLLVSGTGANTEYAEGDIDASVTGIAMMWRTGGNIMTPVDATNPLPVSGTFVDDSEFPAAAVLTDNFANPTTTNVFALGGVFDGATWDRLPGTSTDGALVNLGTNNDVIGTLTNNAAAPSTTNLGSLTALANAAAPSWTEGRQVLLSVDLSGALRVSGGGGGTQYAVDAIAGVADTGTLALLVRDDALATLTPVDGDYVQGRVNARGALWVAIEDSAGGQAPVSATDGLLVNLGANNDVVADTELPAAVSLADNAANPTAPAVGAFGMVWDGATWDRSPGTAADGTLVNLGTNNDVVVTKDSLATFDHGSNRDVDTAAEQITTTSIVASKGVEVKAASSNTDIIYVGNSDVTAGTTDATDGFELTAGESIFVPVDNANKVYVIASAVNQIVYFLVI